MKNSPVDGLLAFFEALLMRLFVCMAAIALCPKGIRLRPQRLHWLLSHLEGVFVDDTPTLRWIAKRFKRRTSVGVQLALTSCPLPSFLLLVLPLRPMSLLINVEVLLSVHRKVQRQRRSGDCQQWS